MHAEVFKTIDDRRIPRELTLRRRRQFHVGKGLFAYELAVIHAALGDQDAGFKWLALAVEERSGWIAYLRVDPRLDHLHTDPRFTRLIPAA
jgi:hypothetical protein